MAPEPTKEIVAIEFDGTEPNQPITPDAPPEDVGKVVGTRFGEYDILSEIARGGMGVVYRARQRTLKRIVALKVLRGSRVANEKDIDRFMREAKAAASLSHPNIVPIHELSVYKGLHFFTMDYIDGTPLDSMLKAGALTPYQACELIEVIARAIHFAHTCGIIHRDLKPGNIIIDTDGRPMITDFGLAVNMSSDVHSQRMTRDGVVMGTIPYIPPEQAAGHVDRVDECSDIYSLGAVLYEILTGKPPFQGETQYEILRRVIHQDPTPPRKIYPKIHPDVETICLKCLEKDPRRRYRTANALADDCRAFLDGEVIEALPSGFAYRLMRKALRHRFLVVLLSCIVLLAFFAVSLFHRSKRQEQEKKEIKVQLDDVKLEKSLAEMEVAEYKEQLTRTWRQEFHVAFDNRSWWTDNAANKNRLWIDKKRVRTTADQKALQFTGEARDKPVRSLFGFHKSLPLDFKLTCQIRVPEENPGTLLVLVNTDSNYRKVDTTQVVHLGVPGYPGGKITRGEATLAENPNLEIIPTTTDQWESGEGWHNIELVREEGKLLLWVDRKKAAGEAADGERPDTLELEQADLEHLDTVTLGDTEIINLALGTRAGTLQIREISVAVKGLSQPMIRSLLETAGSLNIQREHQLARMLYERVAAESTTTFGIHMKALRGCARCLATAYKDDKKLPDSSRKCIASIQKHRGAAEKGELEFFTGLVFIMLPKPQLKIANQYFTAAHNAALLKAEDFVRGKDCAYIGPFAAPEGFATSLPLEQDEFDPKAKYHSKIGDISWKQLGDQQRVKPHQLDLQFVFPGKPQQMENSIFYVRRTFHCTKNISVTVHTGSDDGMVMWVNNWRIFSEDSERDLKPDTERHQVRFRRGENVVMLKIHNHKGITGFALQASPDLSEQPISPYRLLGQLEAALTNLRLKNITNANRQLQKMNQDGALLTLAKSQSEVLRSTGVLTCVLETVDDILAQKVPKDLKTPTELLDSARILFRNAGKELATRYYLLARKQLDQKNWEQVEALLNTSIMLAKDWYPPRLERAQLFFQNDETERGHATLKETTQATPESLGLQIEIARFYLDNEKEDLRDHELAYQAARRAVNLSNGKNPMAWELCARSLVAMGSYLEAAKAVENALDLEKTGPREKLQRNIQEAINRLQREEIVPYYNERQQRLP